jgi:hypothetical protein
MLANRRMDARLNPRRSRPLPPGTAGGGTSPTRPGPGSGEQLSSKPAGCLRDAKNRPPLAQPQSTSLHLPGVGGRLDPHPTERQPAVAKRSRSKQSTAEDWRSRYHLDEYPREGRQPARPHWPRLELALRRDSPGAFLPARQEPASEDSIVPSRAARATDRLVATPTSRYIWSPIGPLQMRPARRS